MKIAILAGGLGERTRELYPNTIKSLIEFNGKPFIYYQLGLLKRNNLKDVVICTGHGSEKLEEYFNKTKFEGMTIKLVKDGETPLGTGGAIKKAIRYLNSSFMVIYGDSYLDFNYKDAIFKFALAKKPALITIYNNNNHYDKSNIRYSGGEIISYNKINPDKRYKYIDYGASIFDATVFTNTPERFDLSDLQKKLVDKKMVSCEVVSSRFYEIGSPEGIKEFKEFVRRCNVR